MNEKYFYDILTGFYERSTALHPKKSILNKQIQSRLQSSLIINPSASSLISQQKQTLASLNNPKIQSPQPLNRSTLTFRSRANSHKSSYSNDSKKSTTNLKLKTDQYFKCHFIYQSTSFIKSLMYSYLFKTVQIENVDLLVYLKERFLQTYLEMFGKSEKHSIEFYWNRVVAMTEKKEKGLEKEFLNAFQHFPQEFTTYLFELTIKMGSQNIDISKITKQLIKKISQSLGYGINYYHVSKKFIRTSIKQGQNLPFFLNIVYIQQQQRFMISDKQLQKPSQDQSIDKIKQKIGQNITKLLKKYTLDNTLLTNLQILVYDSGNSQRNRSRIRDKSKSNSNNSRNKSRKVSIDERRQEALKDGGNQDINKIRRSENYQQNTGSRREHTNRNIQTAQDQANKIKLSKSQKYGSLKVM